MLIFWINICAKNIISNNGMKNIILLSTLICLIFSCSENNDIPDIDCSRYYLPEEPATCIGTLCQSDTCQTYLNVWKYLLMNRNQMSENYFNNHITPCKSKIDKWNSGLSFRINYMVRIDWAEVELWDTFIIWLAPSTSGSYSSLSLPRSYLLSKDHINSAVNIMAFSSRMNTIAPISKLRFNSPDKAIDVLKRAAHMDKFCKTELFYAQPHMVIPPDGHPFLKVSSVLNWDENSCIHGQIDLYTGEFEITPVNCFIIN